MQKERENSSSSTQDQANYRRKAESVVGPDEHLYRINYVGCIFIQIINFTENSNRSAIRLHLLSSCWVKKILEMMIRLL